MKYNIGDKVRIRPDLKKYRHYGKVETNSDMTEFRGDIVTITRIDTRKPITYKIEEDNGDNHWTEAMFVDIEKEEHIKPHHYTINKITGYGTVITLEDGTRIYQSEKGHVVQLSTNSILS